MWQNHHPQKPVHFLPVDRLILPNVPVSHSFCGGCRSTQPGEFICYLVYTILFSDQTQLLYLSIICTMYFRKEGGVRNGPCFQREEVHVCMYMCFWLTYWMNSVNLKFTLVVVEGGGGVERDGVSRSTYIPWSVHALSQTLSVNFKNDKKKIGKKYNKPNTLGKYDFLKIIIHICLFLLSL